MQSWKTWAVVSVAVGLGYAVPAGAAVQYTVTDLGPNTLAAGINNLGHVVGWKKGGDGVAHAFLWDGVLRDLGTFQGLAASATAINDAGQILASATMPDGTERLLVYSQGAVTDLAVLGVAHGINNAGQVVGVGYTGQGLPWSYGFVWQNGNLSRLSVPAGMETDARGINDDGVVVGYVIPATLDGQMAAFRHDGVMHLLESAGVYSGVARAINNRGQIVGDGAIGGMHHAVMWDGDSVVDLGTLGQGTCAVDINDLAQVVGWARSPTGGDDHAFVWAGGVMRDLNDLIPTDSGLLVTMATGINNTGQIAGYGISTSDRMVHALVFTPVPDPATMALVAIGCGFFMRGRQHCRGTYRTGATV
jgi:probable HAF family extracellular repeat protein